MTTNMINILIMSMSMYDEGSFMFVGSTILIESMIQKQLRNVRNCILPCNRFSVTRLFKQTKFICGLQVAFY